MEKLFIKRDIMRKILCLILLVLIVIGCSNKEKQNVLETNTKEEVINNLDKVVTYVQMFPEKDNENKLVNYAYSICLNIDKFNVDELKSIYDKLNFNYSFEYNDLDYQRDDYDRCLANIKNKIDVLS